MDPVRLLKPYAQEFAGSAGGEYVFLKIAVIWWIRQVLLVLPIDR
jgi:hypothetical protein